MMEIKEEIWSSKDTPIPIGPVTMLLENQYQDTSSWATEDPLIYVQSTNL